MNKKFIKVLALTLCFLIAAPYFSVSAAEKPWYEGYVTEYGTTLTRDFSFGLSNDLPPAYNKDMKSNFFGYRSELPDEIPVFAPYTDEEIAKSANKIYVSVDGDDLNPGTIEKPVKTVSAAFELARKQGMKKGGLTIYLREGTYSSTSGFDFNTGINGTQKHPTFISAYPGEEVVLTTAVSVKGSQMKVADDAVANKKLSDTVKGKVYSVNLKELGYTDFGTFSTSIRPTLYVDGVQYQIARWPNAENTGMVKYNGADGEYGVIESGDVTIVAGRTGGYTGDRGIGFEFVMSSSRPLKWENTGNIWMYGYWYEEWEKIHVTVKDFDPEKNSVETVQSCRYGTLYQTHNSYYFYNVLEELDSPGEWFVDDKTGMLYVYPSTDIENSEVKMTTTVEDGITIVGGQDVVFNRITIDTAGKYGYNIVNGRRIILQNSEVKNTANYAINTQGYSCGILNCKVQGNTYISSPYSNREENAGYKSWIPTRNFVQNSIIQGTLQTSWGFQNIVSHNVITGSSTHALYAHREFECIYEYNEIVGGPNVNLDAGLIYVGCTAIHRNNHFRYNYLNKATQNIRGNSYGIYFDDMSSYNFAYGNILRECRVNMHGGSNNVAYNNIVVDNSSSTNSIANSDNYQITADRWAGMIISDTDTRWSRQNRSTYQGAWMARYVNDYELHDSLMHHKYDYESIGYDIATDEFGKYVAAPKNCYYGNNLIVNSKPILKVSTERKALYEDNVELDYIPDFENYKDGLYDLTEQEIKSINPKMEALPTQHKMGLINDSVFSDKKLELVKPKLLAPLNTKEEPIYENENVTLSWAPIFGFSYYNVEVSDTPDFENVLINKIVQVPSLVIPNLEFGKTYYWRVTVGTWSHNFDMTEKTSDVSVFKVGTQEEVELHTEIDLAPVNAQISAIKELIDKIKTDYDKDLEKTEEERIYTDNPVDILKEFVDTVEQRKSTEIKLKKDIDLFIRSMYIEFYDIWGKVVKPHTVNVIDLMTESGDMAVVGKGSYKKTDIGYNFKCDSNVSMISSGSSVLHRPNSTYKIKMKFDSISVWNCLNLMMQGNTAANPTQTYAYFIVFKSDIIELQRYPKDSSWKNGIVQQFDNNKTVVGDDVWFDIDYTVDYTKDGINIKVNIDGKEYFNYTDTLNTTFVYDNIGIMVNSANGVMSVTK